MPDVAFPYRPMRLVIGGRVSFGPPVVTAGAKLAVERLERVGA